MLIRSGRTVLYPALITLVIFKVAAEHYMAKLVTNSLFCLINSQQQQEQKMQIITFVKLEPVLYFYLIKV